MTHHRFTLTLATLCAAFAGCGSTPRVETPPSALPADTAPPPAPHALSTTGTLEARHRQRALAFASDQQWADALAHWEVLALLNPDNTEYRDAVAKTLARISKLTADLLRDAERARQREQLDQATVLYLRVLNLDREHAVAAQALRDIDAERTRRAYANRPPQR